MTLVVETFSQPRPSVVSKTDSQRGRGPQFHNVGALTRDATPVLVRYISPNKHQRAHGSSISIGLRLAAVS